MENSEKAEEDPSHGYHHYRGWTSSNEHRRQWREEEEEEEEEEKGGNGEISKSPWLWEKIKRKKSMEIREKRKKWKEIILEGKRFLGIGV